MELEKTQKNVGKMLERFRKGKEDMSVVFTKGSSFSRGGKDEQGCYSRGRVIIFRNEKKIVDGSYNSKSSDLPKSFQCCIREGDDARCQMIFSCKEAGLGWVLCGFEPREENEDCYTIVLHCVDDGIGGYLWVGQNDESGVTCLDYLCFDLIGQFRLILRFDIRTDKFFGIVIKIAHLYGFQGSWNVIPRMLTKIIDGIPI